MLQRPTGMTWAAMPPPMPAKAGPERVLVIDDSRAQRHLLGSLLRKWGHEVIACETAAEAMELALDPSIGLIVCDWMMPGMTGPEFCRALRKSRREGYAYVLLLTSNSEASALSDGLAAGADDFLSKPVRPPELRARLNAGARIVAMQREVVEKNQLLTSALDEIQALYSEIDEDLDEARRLMESLLQDRHRSFETVDLSLWLQASGHIGGDMLGFFPVNDTTIGIFSLDVSGHGVASAMVAARIAGILSAASPHQNISLTRREDGRFAALPPHIAAERLNAMLLRELRTDRYFTLCLGFLDRATGRLRMVQAGHPHPMLLRADGTIEHVGDGGMPIGLLDDARFETVEVQLRPGDRLLIHTDGLTECPGPHGVELGEDGLERLIRANWNRIGVEFLESLADELRSFAGSDVFPDDASALLIDYNGTAHTLP